MPFLEFKTALPWPAGVLGFFFGVQFGGPLQENRKT